MCGSFRDRLLESALYSSVAFSHAEAMVLFFAIARGAAMALGNFLYAGSSRCLPELLTGYPLYNIRNVIYYPLEVLLMLELLICSQKAGEVFIKEALPWGAFALFLLWGLPHILWHGLADGIVSACRAFIYAAPFYASGKKVQTSYISMLILWFL